MRHSRGRDVRKGCRKPCQGKVSVGLSSILALILTPGPCARAALQLHPHLPKSFADPWYPACAQSCLSTTAQPGSHRAGSDPGHHHQLSFSMSSGTWPIGHSLCHGLFLCHPWLPSSFRAVCFCFHTAFSLTISCNPHKKLKKSHPYLHTPGYSLHYSKA